MLPPRNDSPLWDGLRDTNASAYAAVPGPEAVVVPVVFGLIFVVGVLGNLLVVAVICGLGRRGGAQTPTNVFLLNLSAADLSFLLLCVPPQATVYSLPHWVFGGFLCSFLHFFTSACMFVSIFTLVAMSVDRYLAVVRARSVVCVRSRRNALAGVFVIWTASLACAGPVARHQVLTGHPSAPNSTFCWEDWSGPSRRAYKVLVLVLGFLLPLLLICCCYSRVSPRGTKGPRCHEEEPVDDSGAEGRKKTCCCRKPGNRSQSRERSKSSRQQEPAGFRSLKATK